jgi:hypothetical protein
MQRTSIAKAALFALVTSGGCPPAERPDPPERPPAAVGDADVAEMERTESCANPAIGYSIEYPAGWRTNPGDVMPECALFDPDPIPVEPATELPFDIAVALRREAVPLETLTGAQRGRRVLLQEETTVDGRAAVRMEIETTEDLLRPAGSRTYGYYVDLDGATLVAETHDVGAIAYERKQLILDAMVARLGWE